MFAFHFTRRAALAAILVGAPSATMLTNPAIARPAPADGVRVDVGPLLENSGEPTAGWVAHQLPGAIEAALAGSGQAGTPVSVRIDYVILGASSGEGGPAGSNSRPNRSEKSPGAGSRSRCARKPSTTPPRQIRRCSSRRISIGSRSSVRPSPAGSPKATEPIGFVKRPRGRPRRRSRRPPRRPEPGRPPRP